MARKHDDANAKQSLTPGYFDALYAEDSDPWDFATSAYEHEKYTDTLDALPRSSYESALEIGCSIGVLTRRLADRCARLLSVDVSERALQQARRRCRDCARVRFEKMRVPEGFPDETFDLVLVSEVGYYWSPSDLKQARERIERHLTTGGHLLLVHWTPYVEDYPLTGDEVHEHVREHGPPGLRRLHGHDRAKYRLDLFERAG